MYQYKVKSSIAMIVFNRPDFTKKVFERVRNAQPKKLFVIADGPRLNNQQDIKRCAQVRAIFDDITWECEIHTNFSDINLGCSNRPATGITWVFEQVEEAIILEDDCVPDPTFFRYCDEMLEKYRDDTRVMLVSGTNPMINWKRGDYSYHFSYFGGIWGWASWRRAWKHFDIEISMWKDPEVKDMFRYILDDLQYWERAKIYDKLYNNSKNTTAWDYQWGFSRLAQSGIAVVPCNNLICNIGNGSDATHTKNALSPVANMRTMELEFPIKHPQFVIVDKEYDRQMFNKIACPRWRLRLSMLKHKVLCILKLKK